MAWEDLAGCYTGFQIGSGIGKYFGPKGLVIGAVVGGIAGGVLASHNAFGFVVSKSDSKYNADSVRILVYSAYADITKEQPVTRQESHNLKYAFSSYDDQIQLVGYMHNEILNRLILKQATPENYTADNFSDEEEQIIFNDDFINTLNNIMDGSEKYMFNPDEKMSDRIFLSFREAYARVNTESELKELITEYCQKINSNSELDEIDKLGLFLTFSVATNSFQNWNQNYVRFSSLQ